MDNTNKDFYNACIAKGIPADTAEWLAGKEVYANIVDHPMTFLITCKNFCEFLSDECLINTPLEKLKAGLYATAYNQREEKKGYTISIGVDTSKLSHAIEKTNQAIKESEQVQDIAGLLKSSVQRAIETALMIGAATDPTHMSGGTSCEKSRF